MSGSKHESSHILARWLVVLAGVALIPLAADFNARLATLRQMYQEEHQLAQQINDEQARQADLEATRTYVESDAYMESWARGDARMALPGQVAVIPMFQQPAPVPTPPPPAAALPSTPLDEWWALFFEPSGSIP